MTPKNWLLRSFPCFAGNPTRSNSWLPRSPRQDRKFAFRLWLEPLEDRAVPAVFTVTNLFNLGAGSFRQAILDANAAVGADNIDFNIGVGVQTIAPISALPTITDAVTITGGSQPGFAGTPLIRLDGGSAGAGSGLRFTSSNNFISGLSITSFAGSGIELDGASNTIIVGNYIGLSPDGTTAAANNTGIFIHNGASNNRIGGVSAIPSNVISGNTFEGVLVQDATTNGNFIQNNIIGLSADGTTAVGNGGAGVFLYSGTTANFVGTDGDGANDAGEGNTISGNATGVYLQDNADNNIIAGNRIGTNIAGTAKLGTQTTGIWVFNSTVDGTRIGTGGNGISDALEANVVSGNQLNVNNGGTGTIVGGNFIGSNAAGTASIAGSTYGIVVTGSNSKIGYTTSASQKNIIVGATFGVSIGNATATGNVVAGNFIGLLADGTTAAANDTGVIVGSGATGNTIGGTTVGERNIIGGNSGNGVEITGVGTSGNTVAGNYIGLDVTGDAPLANAGFGVVIRLGATGNTIGGTKTLGKNVISGNGPSPGAAGVGILDSGTTGNFVSGNYIGTDATGTKARGGTQYGVFLAFDAAANFVGTNGDGTNDSDEGNLISGNITGVWVQSNADNNVIAGNYIGTKADGLGALGNTQAGIRIFDTTVNGTRIGTNADGTSDAFERNVISANTSFGVYESGGVGTVVAGNYVGTDLTGAVGLGGQLIGVLLQGATSATVGSNGDGVNDAVERNVITGNTVAGVSLSGATTTGDTVAGNYIGTAANGTSLVTGAQNGIGVTVESGANNNTLGGNNVTAVQSFPITIGAGFFLLSFGPNVTSPLAFNATALQVQTALNALTSIGGAGGSVTVTQLANVYTVTFGGTLQYAILPSMVLTENGIVGTVTIVSQGQFTGNVVSGNTTEGVQISGATTTGNRVQGNYIGTNAAGTSAVANNDGVFLTGNATGNFIGTDGNGVTDSGEGNVISGNTSAGVSIVSADGNRIAGNFIGLNAAGTGSVANRDGVFLQSTGGNIIGTDGSNDAFNANERNYISGNLDRGVVLDGANVVAGNWIGLDITGVSAGTQQFGIQAQNGVRIGTDGNGTADVEERNVISGNTNTGVLVSGTVAVTVAGNYIGTDATGTSARANGGSGVSIQGTNHVIGGTTAAARNIISGNSSSGVSITGVGTSGNLIRGNYIGTNAAGSGVVGNGVGVSINGPVTNNEIGSSTATPGTGAGNVISGNQAQGVLFSSSTGTGNKVQGNIIGLGADGDTVIGNGLGGAANGPGLQVVNSTGLVLIGGVSNLTAVAGGVRNVIAGNPNGDIAIGNGTATNPAIIQGNYLGTDITGTSLRTTSTAILVGSATDLLIGGSGANEGNLIAGGFRGIQISFVSSDGTVIQGNRIGTDKTGTQDIGATTFGIRVSSSSKNTLIGGTTAGAMNLISGNTTGIRIDSNGVGSPTNVLIQGNRIGTKLDGLSALANGTGIEITDSASGVTVGGTVAGASNLISGNTGVGVQITGVGTTGNTIRGNSIFNNTGLGIDLGGDGVTANDKSGHAGPNNYQNFPVLTFIGGGASTNPRGIVNAAANSTYILDFFANTVVDIRGYGQGQRFLGSTTVTTNAVGRANYSVTLASPTTINEFVSVTATDAAGNTSEFAQSLLADVPPTITLNTPSTALIGITLPFTPILSDGILGKTYQSAWSVTFNGSQIPLPNAAFVSTGATDQETYFFTPQQVGTYVVSVTVTDSRGGVTTAVSAPITVNATTLGVTITGNPLGTPVPFAIVTGQPVTLTSRIADPRQLAVDPKTGVTITPNYTFNWSLTRDGIPFPLPVGTVTNASTFTYTPTGGGLFLVSLAVSDGTQAAGADSVSQVVSAAPSAQIVVTPGTAVTAGTVVNLQAVIIDAALRRSLTYSWTVTSDNTQSTLTGTNTTGLFVFTPNAAGNYTVNLTVTDDLGRTGIGAPVQIRVSAAVPTVTVFGAPFTVAPGSSVSLTGAATDADPNRPGSGSANTYTLSWSAITTAGTLTPATGTGASYSFVASAAGTVVVTLTATDQNGVKTSTLTVINVAAAAGALTVTPPVNPTQGQSLTWTASLSPAVTGTVYSWSVFGPDGVTSTFGTGTTNTLTLTNAQPGRYDMMVTATTTSGNAYTTMAPAAGTFVIVPHAPVSVAVTVVPPVSPRINFQEGDTVNLTSLALESGVDLTNLSKASYLWTVTGPNGFFQVGVLPMIGVTPLAAGTYTATLTVRDFTGASGTGSATFAVVHVPPQPTLSFVDIGTDGTIGLQAVVSNPGGQYRFTYTVSLNGQLYLAATGGGSAYTFRIPPLATLGSVTVTVTDSAGATGQLSATIQSVAAGTAATPVAKTVRASDFLAGTTTAIVLALGFDTITVDPTLPDTSTVEFIAVGAHNVFTGGRTINIFQGDSGSNVLNGGIGANTFYASGNDTLTGGAGANRIVPARWTRARGTC